MKPSKTQFPIATKEQMASNLRLKSADYIAAQPKESNGGYLHSGVNQLVRGSQNVTAEPATKGTGFTFTGTTDPYKI